MNIELVKVVEYSPFDIYPELMDIWPVPLNVFASEATEESLAMQGGDGSEIFLILSSGKVIGITGYMPCMDGIEDGQQFTRDSVTKIALRWHGIIPSYRGKGISEQVIKQMATLGGNAFKNASEFVEMVPNNALGVSIAAYFSGLGFINTGKIELIEDFSMEFVEYSIPLEELKNKPGRPMVSNFSIG